MTPHQTVLVSGATGHVGRLIVDQLVADGHRVRALTRTGARAVPSNEVEVAVGSFGDLPEGLFDAVDAAFVFPADGAGLFADGARRHGVARVVLLSSLAAALEHERDHRSVSQRHHGMIERDVRAAGAGATILRPGTFANNLVSWSRAIRYDGGVRGPYPTSSQAPIHEADVAAAAAVALTRPGHEGQTYAMTGPESLTRVEQLDAIGAALGRDLAFTEQEPAAFAAEMARFGVGDDVVQMLLDHWSDTVEEPDVPRPPEHLIGRPAKTLAQWARDHVADFRG